MRNITKQSVTGFMNSKAKKYGKNMEVVQMVDADFIDGTGYALRLWGNTIALRDDCQFFLTLAGHNTVTTRERLNGLLQCYGINNVGFAQRNFAPVIVRDGKVIAEIRDIDYITFSALAQLSCGDTDTLERI